jgi:hypothetical protein
MGDEPEFSMAAEMGIFGFDGCYASSGATDDVYGVAFNDQAVFWRQYDWARFSYLLDVNACEENTSPDMVCRKQTGPLSKTEYLNVNHHNRNHI